MSVTVKTVIRPDKAKKDGTVPIWLRITANRKSRYVSTGIYIEPKAWNANKQCIRASHPIAPALNHKLKDLHLEVQTQALQANTAAEVKAAVTGSSGSFSDYFQKHIDDLDVRGRFWDWKKYRVTLGKLQACFGQEIGWSDLDRDGLRRFEQCLKKKYGNSLNTVRKELQRVSRVCRLAMKDGLIRAEDNPFLFYERPKAQPVSRRKLGIEEIAALASLDLDVGTSLRLARDAFLVSFYTGGARFGDLCRWKRENLKGERLHYRMAKTSNPVSVPVPEPAWLVLVPYLEGKAKGDFLFPFLKPGEDADPIKVRRRISSRNVIVNRDLKTLAELASLEPEGLSFHVARHSYADYARTRGGNLYAISKTLGHSSLQITQTYLKSFDQDAVDELANELWNH